MGLFLIFLFSPTLKPCNIVTSWRARTLPTSIVSIRRALSLSLSTQRVNGAPDVMTVTSILSENEMNPLEANAAARRPTKSETSRRWRGTETPKRNASILVRSSKTWLMPTLEDCQAQLCVHHFLLLLHRCRGRLQVDLWVCLRHN